MIDIVIPLGKCTTPLTPNFVLPDHTELRWCLRSIVKHLTDVRDIYIIGDRPNWLQTGNGLFYAASHDYPGIMHKSKNIFNKLIQASVLRNVSEKFLVIHDDQFLLSDYHAPSFPYYYSSTIIQTLNEMKSGPAYHSTVENTFRAIDNPRALYYDVHAPMIFDKRKLYPLKMFNWGKEFGYIIKSLYCHVNKIRGEQMEDTKIYAQMSPEGIAHKLKGKKWFSTGENCFNEIVIDTMNKLYPEKTLWEK